MFPTKGSTKKEFLHHLHKRKKTEERGETYKPSPLSDLYVKTFTERKVWKWFSRQHEALDYCTVMGEDCLRLFAYEKCDGKRKFLVTTLRQFWEKYLIMSKKEKHFYEVIPLNCTCRLYFDIEYGRELNASLDGVEVLDTFIKYVCHCILCEYNVECSRKHIVDLDSSTEKKFSRHLIFHLEGAVFADNITSGWFVKDICFYLRSFLESRQKNKFLPICDSKAATTTIATTTMDKDKGTDDTNSQQFWQNNLSTLLVNANNGQTFLCDLAVYTKHRNFRLYQSSKVSKNVPLTIAKENEFVFTQKLMTKGKNLYPNGGEIFDPEFQKFSDTLVCQSGRNIHILTYRERSMDKNCTMPKPLREGCQSSPYPDLDVFVMQNVKRMCNRGFIRRCFDQGKRVIYDIDDNQWCGNVNREHKSNHVYYIADLKFNVLYQKCHDPDCAKYKSVEISIPDEVNPMMDDIDIEDFDISPDVELNRWFSDDITVPDNNDSNSHKNKNKNSSNNNNNTDSTNGELNGFAEEDLNILFDDDIELPNFVSNTTNDHVDDENGPALQFDEDSDVISDAELSKLLDGELEPLLH